jgi:hypothetical protein
MKGGIMPRKKDESSEDRPSEPTNRVMVTRRLPRDLWTRLQNYVASIEPRTTDTAIIELALKDYLDKHEGTRKRKGE